MKLSEAFPNEFLPQRVAIIGLPGSGKTTLAAELAEHDFDLHWIDVENGAETLLKLSDKAKDHINYIRLKDSAVYPIAADTLIQLFKTGKGTICREHSKFNCALCAKNPEAPKDTLDFSALSPKDVVVIDSGTQWSNSILAHVMKGKPIDAKPERDDWGGLRKHTEFALSQMQAASFNLVVIFHAQEAELETGAKKLVPTFGSAGMSTEVAKAFSHVIYCDIRNKKHVAFSSSTALPNVMTKSRTDFEIEKLPTPSLAPIFIGAKAVPVAGEIIPAVVTEDGTLIPTPNPTPSPAQQAFINLKNKVTKS